MTTTATLVNDRQPAGEPHREFSDLLPAAEWRLLPAAVRRRFSNRFRAGWTTCYRGHVVRTRMSAMGWLLAQLARVFGAPLPTRGDAGIATVIVTDHPGNQGQVWTRLYHRGRGFPQAIHSIKRFSGPTGLEEVLGFGLSMALKLHADCRSLWFVSAGFFLTIAGSRFELPAAMCPGQLTVTHTEEGSGWFSFDLRLQHRFFGTLIEQRLRFQDDAAGVTNGPTGDDYLDLVEKMFKGKLIDWQ